MALSSLTVLDERYAIQRVAGRAGSFTVSYLGWSVEEEAPVLIQEYFPERLAQRAADGTTVELAAAEGAALFQAGKKDFLKEGRLLSQIQHANLPAEHAPFEANGTAYRVSRYHPGISLAEALARRGAVSEQAARAILLPILEALGAAHERGLLHGGFAPEAIHLAKSRRSLLTGFRGARIQFARRSRVLSPVILPGVSPPEQYAAGGRQGPWTDLYAAAATFYQAVAGHDLPEAPSRIARDPVPEMLQQAGVLQPATRAVLAEALAVDPRDRLQSVAAFLQMMEDPPPALAGAPLEAKGAEARRVSALGARPLAPEEGGAQDTSRPSAAAQEAAQGDAAAEDNREGEAPVASVEASASAAHDAQQNKTPPAGEGAAPAAERRADRWPALPRPPQKRSAAVSGRVLALAFFVFALVGGSALALLGGWSDAEERQAQYAALRAQADSLFEQGAYAEAREHYLQARALAPEREDTHVAARIVRVNRVWAARREARYDRHVARARQLEARADSLRAAGQQQRAVDAYAEANAAYLAALDSRPGDSLAYAKARAMNAMLGPVLTTPDEDDAEAAEAAPEARDAALLEEEVRRALYARYREQGDGHFAAGDYEAARSKFSAALDFRPGDGYAARRLEAISTLLSRREREHRYDTYRRRGDRFFEAGQYLLARREYDLALSVRPGDAGAARRLEVVDSLLAEAERSEQQYHYHRAQGDILLAQENFRAALMSYWKAFEQRPHDGYVQNRIAEAQGRIEALRFALRQEERSSRSRRPNGTYYTAVDRRPELIGGLAALHRTVDYPEAAVRRGIEGRVVVQMVVDAEGRVRDPEVIKGIGGGCDEEALRVVRSARFEPALVDGQPVPALHSLWVQFRLEE